MAYPYGDKLKSPEWQKKRLLVFQRDNWTCRSCFRTDICLHVHHLKYIPGLEPWEYDDHYLITYCEICHNTEHLIGAKINDSLLEIIHDKPLLIKQVAQLCILFEECEGFDKSLAEFISTSLVEHLQTQKHIRKNDEAA